MIREATPRSALAALRAQIPHRPLTPSEAKHILERQATRLLRMTEIFGPPVPVEAIIQALPRLVVKRVPDLPSSGRAQWNGRAWVLLVDATEPRVRQRFSLAHELAHVIWHPLVSNVLLDTAKTPATERVEYAADYFAACLLMPRVWMKRAYFDEGIQDLPALARLFNVSWPAMRLRLEQLGFVAAPALEVASREAV